MSSIEKRVREWIVNYPGLIRGAEPPEVLAKALNHCGVQCSPDEFRVILDRCGYKVDQIRANLFQLALPKRPRIPHSNAGALRKLAGEG